MLPWQKTLKHNPIPTFLKADDPALIFHVRKDLLHESVGPEKQLWDLPETQKILRKQQPDGRWKYPTKRKTQFGQRAYDLHETYRQLRYLIEKFKMTKEHQAIELAAEFCFSFLSKQGDLRGIYGNQYSPNYTAVYTELLIKAGYQNDKRTTKILKWLLSTRQDDGGWAIPIRTSTELDIGAWNADQYKLKTVEPDRSKPFSHLITGKILRAFAAHPKYKKNKDILKAADLLKSRFFVSDKYPDRKTPAYWFRINFPYTWTDIISSLDILVQLGYKKTDKDVKKALDWICKNQQKDGLWPTGYGKGKFATMNRNWVGLAICRILKAID